MGRTLTDVNSRPIIQRLSAVQINDAEFMRLAEFGSATAALIHEISTPLTSATISLSQLRGTDTDNIIKDIRRDLKQLERYVVAARKQLKGEAKNESFSLTVAIHQVAMMLDSRAKKARVKLLINTLGSIRLYGDKIKFHQIITNLINNAIDSYTLGDKSSRLVLINVTRSNGRAIITVKDSGCGINEENLKKIFDPFYSTKRVSNLGMGIGLALTKQYIEQDFRGKVDVKSQIGAGTIFTVSLPINSAKTSHTSILSA